MIQTSELVMLSGISFINITKRMGPMTLPCGTPLQTSDHADGAPFTVTRCRLPDTNASSHGNSFPLIPSASHFLISRLWGTLSKALAKSRYMTSMVSPASRSLVQRSSTSKICVVHDLFPTKACWNL